MDNGHAVKDQVTEAEAYERIRDNSEEIYHRMQRLIQPTDIIPAINNNVFPPKPSGLCREWCQVKCAFNGRLELKV